MTKSEFINLFTTELEIENKNITEDTDLDSLEEWNSMGIMVIVSTISDNFNIDLKVDEVRKFKKIKNLIEKIDLK